METLIKERLELIHKIKEIIKNIETSEEEKNIIKEKLIKQFLYEEYIDDYDQEKPIEPIDTPVTQDELLAKFPTEPDYPELRLADYNIEINLKEDLLSLEVEEGTVVKTKGYYEINDGGQAC